VEGRKNSVSLGVSVKIFSSFTPKKNRVSLSLSVRIFSSSTPKKKQREFEFECEEKAKVKRSYSNPQKKE
jgi:hypothetical protein